MSRRQSHTVSGKVDSSFRERALAEAARYGSDSWVFLRELLQNARDAGAARIDFTVSEEGDTESVSCRDDGCGMSAVHAHRYLFALYASSKEGDARQAGQFGVGFWSVLRFKPDKVVIRSRPRGGEAWQVELNHRLENAVFTAWEMGEGTEIVLERRRARFRDGEGGRRTRPGRPLSEKVFDAVFRYGRFLTRCKAGGGLRRRRESPIRVTVNGRPANADLELSPPSSCFRRRRFRGAVALGSEPRVELFANGLFVRRATCLEDLLEGTADGDLDDDRSSLDLPGSLAPQVVLDSSRLEPLLARSDVRQTKHLRQLVRTAERELERLIERQLAAVRPQPWFLPLLARLRALGGRLAASRRLRAAWWLAPMALAGILAGWLLAGWTVDPPAPAVGWAPSGPSWLEAGGGFPAFGRGAVGDLGESYRGPQVDPVSPSGELPKLSYRPAEMDLLLTALVVESPDSSSADSGRAPVARGPYAGASCPVSGRGCVTVRLTALGGPLRLPVPVGHLVDPLSVRRNGRPQELLAAAGGEALVQEVEENDVLEYRTAPAAAPEAYRPEPAMAPQRLREIAKAIAHLPPDERVAEAVERVRRLVVYDRSDETVRRHRAAAARGHGFADAALLLGKGDCDVQNGILVMLLRETGMTARLAVGYVGRKGRALAGLHAWAEVLGQDRRFRAADVSAGSAPAEVSQLLWLTSAGASAGVRSGRTGLALSALDRGEPWVPAVLGVLLSRLAAPPGWLRHGPSALAGAALVLFLALLVRRHGLSPARVRLAEPDLAALLGGALQHPGLARLPALAHGRFIPLIPVARTGARRRRRAISLHAARRRAARGLLLASAVGSRLARAAAGRGIPVIDSGAAEGRVAALGLGAVDLDEWSDLLDRGETSALVDHLNGYLDSIGVDWRLILASPLSRPLKVVDLALLGLGRRQVLIDPRSADFAAAGPRLELKSDAAAFRLLDVVVDHLDLARCDRARLLADLARRAVVEKHGR